MLNRCGGIRNQCGQTACQTLPGIVLQHLLHLIHSQIRAAEPDARIPIDLQVKQTGGSQRQLIRVCRLTDGQYRANACAAETQPDTFT
jgi:hypothetical protein